MSHTLNKSVPVVLAAMALLSQLVSAQSPGSGGEPAFEVASVKVNASGVGPRFARPASGGKLSVVNMPLSDLILFAYGFQGAEFRLAGVPAWASSTNYDVTATMDARYVRADGGFAIEDMRAMTQALLRDRFKLAAHMESRELPIYALVKSRGDGRLGARLQPSGSTCPPIALPAGVPLPPPPPGPPSQGSAAAPDLNCTGFAMPGHIFARKLAMSRFADMLSIFVRRVVVDRTSVDGLFDFDLDYAPDPAIAQQGVAGRPPGAPPPPGVDANAAELFTAIQEQLGLRLESTKGAIDVLVVDRVEKPAED